MTAFSVWETQSADYIEPPSESILEREQSGLTIRSTPQRSAVESAPMLDATYHLESLAATMVYVSSATFLALAPAVWRFPQEFRASLRAWTVGTALVVSTDIVFFLGIELPWLDTILIAVQALGAVEWIHALRLFGGQSRRARWPYAIVALSMVLSALSPDYRTSAIVSSASFAVLYLAAAHTAMSLRDPRKSVGRAVFVGAFGLIGLVMLGRIALSLSGLTSGAPPGFTSMPRALMFVISSTGPVAGSLAFFVMCGERLGDQLRHLSLTDPLTGISNRRAFFEALERALSSGRRRMEPVALMVVDVDYFKRINDTAGHAGGDQALIAVAQTLVSASRSEDTVGRIGGEEFGVVVPGADRATAAAVAERFREVVAGTPILLDDRSFVVTVSIGVAVTLDETQQAASLLAAADEVLYEAKRQGRNRVVTAAPAPAPPKPA